MTLRRKRVTRRNTNLMAANGSPGRLAESAMVVLRAVGRIGRQR
jgi:hypothetical protein